MSPTYGEVGKVIQELALQIINENPSGIRYSVLLAEIMKRLPADVNRNSVPANVVRLIADFPTEVYKPSRGLFAPRLSTTTLPTPAAPAPSPFASVTVSSPPPPLEAEFYEPFAEYLKGELDECTRSLALGGHVLKRKWATPDVMGVYQSRITDIIKGEPVIVSAEIKNDDRDLITGFGQACSYRLFSHKVYLVIPADSDADERGRVEALCQLFGLGLVLFNRMDPDNPDWEIRVRASRGEPDLFYVNEYLRDIATDLFGP